MGKLLSELVAGFMLGVVFWSMAFPGIAEASHNVPPCDSGGAYCHLHPDVPPQSTHHFYAYDSTSGFSDNALAERMSWSLSNASPPYGLYGWYLVSNSIAWYTTKTTNHHRTAMVTYDYDCFINWNGPWENPSHPLPGGSTCPGSAPDGAEGATWTFAAIIDYGTVPWHEVITYSHSWLDRGEILYKGTGSISSGHLDLWSVVIHELGHQQGLGDLAVNDPSCPDDGGSGVGRATMCWVFYGMTKQRSPDTEDISSMNQLY